MASEEWRRHIAILDWENEMKYQETLLKSDLSEERKEQARKRIQECKDWINKINGMSE